MSGSVTISPEFNEHIVCRWNNGPRIQSMRTKPTEAGLWSIDIATENLHKEKFANTSNFDSKKRKSEWWVCSIPVSNTLPTYHYCMINCNGRVVWTPQHVDRAVVILYVYYLFSLSIIAACKRKKSFFIYNIVTK